MWGFLAKISDPVSVVYSWCSRVSEGLVFKIPWRFGLQVSLKDLCSRLLKELVFKIPWRIGLQDSLKDWSSRFPEGSVFKIPWRIGVQCSLKDWCSRLLEGFVFKYRFVSKIPAGILDKWVALCGTTGYCVHGLRGAEEDFGCRSTATPNKAFLDKVSMVFHIVG